MLLVLNITTAAGSVQIELDDWEVDAAYLQTNKLIHGGIESIGTMYVNRNIERTHPGIKECSSSSQCNWNVIEAPLSHSREADTLTYAKVNASLDYFIEAGVKNVQKKNFDLYLYQKRLISSLK